MRLYTALFIFIFSFSSLAEDLAAVFGRLPLVDLVQISPNGKKIAYLRDVNGIYYLLIQELYKPEEQPKAFALRESKIRDFTWANDERILFDITKPFYSEGDYETFTMYRTGLLNVNTTEAMWPFDTRRFDLNIGGPSVESLLIDDEHHVLMSNYYTSVGTGAQQNVIYRVNLKDGDRDEVFKKPYTDDWILDRNGDVVLYRGYYRPIDDWVTFVKVDDDDFEPLKVKTEDGEEYFEDSIITVSQKQDWVYYHRRNNEGVRVLARADLNGNYLENEKIVSTNTQYDLAGIVRNTLTWQINGYYVEEDTRTYTYYEREIAQIQADLEATFPEASCRITSYSKDYKKVIVKVSGDQFPEQYFLYDVEAGAISVVGVGFPIPKALSLSKVSKFDYTSSDGLPIEAYLTTPSKRAEGKLPLIVLPHGGPAARDNKEFQWIRQFYAANGFAVFQPNFRGSDGYGKDFEELGHGEWGKKMQSDVDDGVRELLKSESIDSERVCIVGASYGGYVALYAATQNNGLYKCAVSFAGISELGNVLYHATEQKTGFSYWEKSIGKLHDTKTLKAYSPLENVSSSTLPTLLMHGTEDTIVPLFQSQKMYKAMKKSGVKGAEYFEIEGEDHWFTLGASRETFLRESLRFIHKHLE